MLGLLSNDPLDIATWNSSGGLTKVYRWNNVFQDGKWVVLTLTWNGTTLALWINGRLAAQDTTVYSTSGTMTSTDRAVSLGGVLNGWAGDISSLAIWNTMDASTINTKMLTWKTGKIDYRQASTGYAINANLQHWWKPMSDPDTIGKSFFGGEDLDSNTGSISKTANGSAEGY